MPATIVPLITVDPDRPYTSDGRCFDELHLVDPDLQARLIARGLAYLTSFRLHGEYFAGSVIAGDWRTAQRVADARRLGERVDGLIARRLPV